MRREVGVQRAQIAKVVLPLGVTFSGWWNEIEPLPAIFEIVEFVLRLRRDNLEGEGLRHRFFGLLPGLAGGLLKTCNSPVRMRRGEARIAQTAMGGLRLLARLPVGTEVVKIPSSLGDLLIDSIQVGVARES